MNKRAETVIFCQLTKRGKYPIISIVASSKLELLIITTKVQRPHVSRLFRRDIQPKSYKINLIRRKITFIQSQRSVTSGALLSEAVGNMSTGYNQAAHVI